jgi:hypothetical protein
MQDIVQPDLSVEAFLSSNCTKSGTTYTCDVTAWYTGVKDACGEEGGKTIRVKVTLPAPLTAEGGGQSATTKTYIVDNISACIGAKYLSECDADTGFFVKLKVAHSHLLMRYEAIFSLQSNHGINNNQFYCCAQYISIMISSLHLNNANVCLFFLQQPSRSPSDESSLRPSDEPSRTPSDATRMHYGAVAVSALVMAGVAFLN